MSATDAPPAVDFDHHSPDFASSWRDQLSEMRGRCPVGRSTAHGSFLVVTRYDDILRILRDHKTFASARDVHGDGWADAGGVTIPTNQGRMGFMEMDPPESLKYRKLVNPWLSRAAVQQYRPRIAEIVSWCIDRFCERGEVEFVRDLANPLPAIVTLDALGIALDDWHVYAEAAHGAAYREPGSGQKLKWVMQNVRDIVREGAYEPESLIASWTEARIDGEPLGPDMVCELVYMTLNGGIDTTTSLIANSAVQLDADPGVRERLLDDRQLIPSFVQEMLRFCVPSTGIARTSMVDTEIGGVPVRAGTRLLLVLASANFDDDRFEQPSEVDVDRQPNVHLSFGSGAHRCVGAELATAELEELTAELLRRIPDFRIDRVGVDAYPTMPLVNGFISVPATFTPTARSNATSTALPVLTEARLRPGGGSDTEGGRS